MHSLQIKHPPILCNTLTLLRGGGLFSNIQLVMTVCPNKCVEEVKPHNKFGCSYPEEQQQCWSCSMRIFPSLLVLPTEKWQCYNLQLSVMTGDEGRLGNSHVCLCPQSTTKALITAFAKLRASKKFYKWFTDYAHRLYIHGCDHRSKLLPALFGAFTIECIEFQPLTVDYTHIYGSKSMGATPPRNIFILCMCTWDILEDLPTGHLNETNLPM